MRYFCYLVLIFAALGAQSCAPRDTTTETVTLIVHIPPAPDPSLSDGQNQCVFRNFLFPEHPDDCRNAPSLPANDDSLITVELTSNGAILLNGETTADLSRLQKLSDRLRGIFTDRETNGVYEPLGDRVVKAVGIKAPQSAAYGDVIGVVRSVDDAGADPIVLLMQDRLPYQLVRPF